MLYIYDRVIVNSWSNMYMYFYTTQHSYYNLYIRIYISDRTILNCITLFNCTKINNYFIFLYIIT
jgi:hypothetical protein